MDFLAEFEAAGACSGSSPFFSSHSRALSLSTMTGLGEDLDTCSNSPSGFAGYGEGSEEEEDGDVGCVVWQSSQSSSTLESLLRGGKSLEGNKGKGKPKPKTKVPKSGQSSVIHAGPSSSTFNFDAFECPETTASTSTLPRALEPSSRRNVSSELTPDKATTAPAPFSLLLKRIASQTGSENLSSNSPNGRPTPSSRMRSSRSGGITFGADHSRKPVSTSSAESQRPVPLHDRARGMGRAVSANAVIGRGRDEKGKGRCESDTSGSELDSIPVKRVKLDSFQAPRKDSSSKVREVEATKPCAVVRRDMPPPPLPPERGRMSHTMSSQHPPVSLDQTSVSKHTEPPMLPSELTAPAPEPPVQKPVVLVPMDSTKHCPEAKAARSTAAVPPTINNSTSTTTRPAQPDRYHPPPPRPQPEPHRQPSQPPQPSQHYLPGPSQFRPSQASRGGPPALGMRRHKTFSSSGSQSAYSPFGFASQVPNNGALPTRQRAFRPPRTKSTLALFEGFDFDKEVGGGANAGKAAESGRAVEAKASGTAHVASARAGSSSVSPPPVSEATASGSSNGSKSGSASPAMFTGPNSVSTLATSPECSRTSRLSLRNRDAESKINDEEKRKVAHDSVDEGGDAEPMLEDDPNDSSYGELDMGIDFDALEDVCSKYD